MATTPEDLQSQDDEYSAAFAEPEQEKPEVSEDEAFGLLPEQPEDGTSTPSESETTEAAPVVSVNADEDQGGNPVETPDDGGEKPGMTKDQQREASWEGRLKAREAELRAREDALRAMEAELQSGKPGADGTPSAERAEEAGEAKQLSDTIKQVEDGDMTADQAMSQLSSDFGPEFAKAVSTLIKQAALDTASKVADERIGPVNKSIEDLVSGITDKSARDHFEAIAEAHPDFADIADGQELKDYLASLPEGEQSRANATIASGSARQIVKLLDNVKSFAASQKQTEPETPAADPQTEAAMDAAEGVRSTGLRIPEKPSASGDSYEDAWNSIPD